MISPHHATAVHCAFRIGLQAHHAGLSDDDCDAILEAITGSFETKARLRDVVPAAAREIERLQPHRFTRTETLHIVRLAIQIYGDAR